MREFVKRHPEWVLGIVVFAIALLVRMPDLGAGTNVDAVLYWFGRTRKFWGALEEGRFADTFFSPHPGVSIMWLSGLGMGATGTLAGAVTERTVVAATAPLTFLASLVPGLTVPLLYRALGAPAVTAPSARRVVFDSPVPARDALVIASLAGAFLATEPFLVAHARTFHLDATATGFVWLGVLLTVLTLVERHVGWAAGAGWCFGIAMLTRMLSGTFIVGIALAALLLFALEGRKAFRLPLLFALLGAVTCLTIFSLWPALWVEPVETFRSVLAASGRTVEKGHRVFSWGTKYDRDPGAAFYAGVMLMRLSPELFALALLGLAFAWRWPRRSLVVLVVLACAYVLPAAGLLMGPKKGDRYPLLFFPFLTFLGVAGVVELVRHVPLAERFAKRRVWLVAGVLGALFALRLVRLVSVHPAPIAWCASYPGLRCEDVITLGNGEGFRDAALWIAENTPVRKPNVLSAYSGGAVLAPWLDFHKVRDGAKAHFVLTYLSMDQRGLDPQTRRFAAGEPLHEVRLGGRTYVRIFAGPAHPDAPSR